MKNTIPVFFATDDNYVPFLGVTLKSMMANASQDYFYRIYVLSTGLKKENMAKIENIVTENESNFKIEFVSLEEQLKAVTAKFSLRDYYSMATYYRIFIPDMFPQYEKALYLDCDIAIIGDISELYNHEIGSNYIGAIQDESLFKYPEFGTYVEKGLGIPKEKYFNAGIMVMNLKEFRAQDLFAQFIALMKKYTCKIAQDQDYLNILCKNKVRYIDVGWNKGAILTPGFDESKLKLVHYNLNRKPWQKTDVKYQEYFWDYAKQTEFYDQIRTILENTTDEMRANADNGLANLIEMCALEAESSENYYNLFIKPNEPEKAADRVAILEKIDDLERKQLWSHDVEDDPETIPLTEDKVDYFHKKITSKTKTFFINMVARRFIKMLMKHDQLIIKEVHGIENFEAIKKEGAILTCNHFNPFDNFAVYKAIEKDLRRKTLYKVIREGNYTSFKGLFGIFFRNCNTLPLSSNASCMKKFMDSVSYHLSRGEKILIYPEQGMWWNYKKPRPMQNGAFRFAAMNGSPVLPIFITMQDSEKFGKDGFPIQEYTVHILPAIYPDSEKSARENAEMMKQKNFEMWKQVYEEVYGIPLMYLESEDCEQSA